MFDDVGITQIYDAATSQCARKYPERRSSKLWTDGIVLIVVIGIYKKLSLYNWLCNGGPKMYLFTNCKKAVIKN